MDLNRGFLLHIDQPRNVRIEVITGTVWATQLGDPKDHVLGPGQTLAFKPEGAVVINSLGAPSRFRLFNANARDWSLLRHDKSLHIAWDHSDSPALSLSHASAGM